MSQPLLYNVLFAWKCSSTHHKLALDALRHLKCPQAEEWRNFFLANIERYLEGSKAPDNTFKDFKNHVLHVSDNFWGGAVQAAQTWYEKLQTALREKRWSDVVYSAGVLSHYYSDPWQPFHTGQSETETVVHRAAEWSIACSYSELQDILESDLGGYPEIKVPSRDDWLATMIRDAATAAHAYYQPSIDHYNFAVGKKDPPAGYDQEAKDFLAVLLGSAVIGYARILDRAISEAEVSPPGTQVTLLGIMAQMTVPIFWVTKKMKNAKERAVVEAMYREFEQTGKVAKTLPADDRAIRQMHAEEVLKTTVESLDEKPIGPLGTAFGTGTPARPRKNQSPPAPVPVESPPVKEKATKEPAAKKVVNPPASSPKTTAKETTAKETKEKPETPISAPPTSSRPAVAKAAPSGNRALKFYLTPEDLLEAAPSIGAKTAARLDAVGLRTVQDLLQASPESIAKKLNLKHIDATQLRAWQAQALLVCDVPGLRGHDAQILTACGVTDRETLAASDEEELFLLVEEFAYSSAGEKVLRDQAPPDREEVQEWVAAARFDTRSAAA